MNSITIGTSDLQTSRLGYGCWRIAETEEIGSTTGREAILAAYEAGYTLFDHADIYCQGRAESAFGNVLHDVTGMRDAITIATKCGIRGPEDPKPGNVVRYDFSAEYIIQSCEKSLERLKTETIDLYQLHRPDWLMDPAEVADAFDQLKQQGKVREFGVSNFAPSQVTALQSACPMHLQVQQVEISLVCLERFIDGSLDQCLAEKITPLAWSPLGGGLLAEGARSLLPGQQGYNPTPVLKEIDVLAKNLECSRGVIGLAWLLKHPSGIVPLVGSTKPDKIKDAVNATHLSLSREEWYKLLEASRGESLP
ncbi:MAG: aldo/keto reductase [Limisphaerales bacterium]